MLSAICSALLELTLAAAPPPQPLRPLMLDAPAQALERGQALLSRPGLGIAERESLLRDMATAALLLNGEQASRIAAQLESLGRDQHSATAMALADVVRAHVRMEGDDIESGLALANAATLALRRLEHPYWSAVAELETCDVLLTAARAGPARPYCERAHTAWQQLDDRYALARSENLLQWALGATGETAAALALALSARKHYEALGSKGGVAMMDDNAGALYLALGQPQTALAASRRALAYELANGKAAHAISSRRNIAKALAALGQHAEALRELAAALAEARRLELGRISAQLLATQAEVAEAAGQLPLALYATRELIQLNARLSSREVERAVAELDARYGAQTREAEIRGLRQAGELQSAHLRAAEADRSSEQARARFYSLALIAALSVGLLLAALITLRLRWLKQLNTALNQVNRTRADMLAMAAHEVRNPIAAISGLIDLSLQRVHDKRARNLLETARATSAGLVRTAEDYLDHARLALDRVDLRDEPFDLPPLLNQVASLYRPELSGRPIRLKLVASENLPLRVCGDAARLQQVLVNLLGNAVKFTSAGEIRLHAEAQSGGRVRFAIADSGPGILAQEVERLLQPFERGAGRTRRGAGLGLSIANQLVQIMGGELAIESQPGVGSCFSFTLPLPPGPPESTVELPPPVRGRVLLVDDDSAIRELLSAQLDMLGIEHRVAADIAAALSIWREFAPETLLVDLHLDGENGIDLIRQIRIECGSRRPPRCLIHSASPPDGPHDRPPVEWNIEWVRKPMPLRDLGRLLGGEAAATPTAVVA
ncbi:signal transduction histidine kinase [Tahibacter aquaticus]|uniref:histidine kinase n=1 Tax=Tahibacter aquaticus TaxID=520092 RepID=A0A4R6YXZ4_9GAMM|nr:hybrid sensor histidine kinase/response regulator [Tahibacter aquaticus]TDR43869.1 signal transduction histidine kinase [Tahibacter aquaticus]